MLFNDHFNTIASETAILFRDKGSKFYAFAYPVLNEETFKSHLQKLKQKYPDATHHCYALVLHPDKSFQKSSDDGEPSNTAGKPILRAILSSDLTNIAVIVVRYFGGTMLGVPGLINAYNKSAMEALQAASIKQIMIEDRFMLTCALAHENDAHRMLKKLEGKVLSIEYTDEISIIFSIERAKTPKIKGFEESYYNLKINPI